MQTNTNTLKKKMDPRQTSALEFYEHMYRIKFLYVKWELQMDLEPYY